MQNWIQNSILIYFRIQKENKRKMEGRQKRKHGNTKFKLK